MPKLFIDGNSSVLTPRMAEQEARLTGTEQEQVTPAATTPNVRLLTPEEQKAAWEGVSLTVCDDAAVPFPSNPGCDMSIKSS